MPPYDELSPFQWVQGYANNVLAESDHQAREVMLVHLGNLMQDAQDLSWRTAKRAHAQVLMKIERGQLDWRDEYNVDRIRQRHTQRAMKKDRQSVAPDEPKQIKICRKWNEGNCDLQTDHPEKNIIYRHSCWKCWKATKQNSPHRAMNCTRPRQHAADTRQKSV